MRLTECQESSYADGTQDDGIDYDGIMTDGMSLRLLLCKQCQSVSLTLLFRFEQHANSTQ